MRQPLTWQINNKRTGIADTAFSITNVLPANESKHKSVRCIATTRTEILERAKRRCQTNTYTYIYIYIRSGS